jgi:hypothetical protein
MSGPAFALAITVLVLATFGGLVIAVVLKSTESRQ